MCFSHVPCSFFHQSRYRKLPIRKMIIIRTARIPIIKLETTTRVTADISLGDSSGPRAANYIAQQVCWGTGAVNRQGAVARKQA